MPKLKLKPGELALTEEPKPTVPKPEDPAWALADGKLTCGGTVELDPAPALKENIAPAGGLGMSPAWFGLDPPKEKVNGWGAGVAPAAFAVLAGENENETGPAAPAGASGADGAEVAAEGAGMESEEPGAVGIASWKDLASVGCWLGRAKLKEGAAGAGGALAALDAPKAPVPAAPLEENPAKEKTGFPLSAGVAGAASAAGAGCTAGSPLWASFLASPEAFFNESRENASASFSTLPDVAPKETPDSFAAGLEEGADPA